MQSAEKITQKTSGYADNDLTQGALVRIFDKFWGLGNQHLPIYPEIIGQVTASWTDGTGSQHHAKHFDDLLAAYEAKETAKIQIAGSVNNGPRTTFVYIPARKKAGLSVTADEPTALDFINFFKEIFPILDTPIIFVSYATEELHLADYVAGLINQRFGEAAKVFVAKRNIPSGKNPLQTMFDENLLKARCVVAICSETSKGSNWLWWETSAVWARERLVYPLFANISANEFGEPIKTLFQGNDFFKVDDLEKMIADIAKDLGIEIGSVKLSENEITDLNLLARNSKCVVVVEREKTISEESEKHLYSLMFAVTNQESKAYDSLDVTLIFPTVSIQTKKWEYAHLRSKEIDRTYTELHFSFNGMPEGGQKQFRPNLLPGRTFILFGEGGITHLRYIANDSDVTP